MNATAWLKGKREHAARGARYRAMQNWHHTSGGDYSDRWRMAIGQTLYASWSDWRWPRLHMGYPFRRMQARRK